ncbi:MAG TPA: ATP synthase subunit I [Candidatus Angelobacter sp.]|nr:ATP synthase subunit I [Candidatus Angelobacter sp.]
MNTPPEDASPDQEIDPAPADQTPPDPAMEERLSGAYRRILRVAIVFSVAGTLAAALLFTWQSGLGLAIGSLLAYINFVWLHRGTERLVERIIASNRAPAVGETKPRKVRFAFPFPLRYALLIAVAYVILKSYPRLLIGFIVGLILPILAAMGEGIYEAVVIGRIDQASR